MLRRLTLLGVSLVLLVLTTTAFFVATSSQSHASTNGPETTVKKDGILKRGNLYTVGKPPESAEKVYFGIEPIQAYGVSLADNTWKVNFYMWYRWKGPIDPVATTLFDNATDAETNFTTTYAYTDARGNEAPIELADGYKYQLTYVQAGFASEFDLSHYPLDSQKLDIRFENSTYDYSQLVYIPDPSGSSEEGFVVSD